MSENQEPQQESEVQESTPTPLEGVVMRHLRRFTTLSLVAFILCISWQLAPIFGVDEYLRLFLGGLAIGVAGSVFWLYRRDWWLSLEYQDFTHSYSATIYQELQVRRKISSKTIRGSVYVIQDTDVTKWYKIGKTTNPIERIGHFDTMLPFQIRVVHIISAKNCDALETMLHRHFASKRKRGEWFALDDADIAWIRALEAV